MVERWVYLVDDDSLVRASTQFLLDTMGVSTRPYMRGTDFLNDVPSLAAGCVLLDLKMSDLDGMEVLRALVPHLGRFSVILLTGHGDAATAREAIGLGATALLEKPFREDSLVRALEDGFARLR